MASDFRFVPVAAPDPGAVLSSWSWRIKGTDVRAHATFTTLEQCVEDARRHGFDPARLDAGERLSDLIEMDRGFGAH